MFYKVADGNQEILLLYLDDLFGTGEGKLILDSKRKLVTEFELEDLGIIHNFLDREVWQKPREIMVSQGKYAVEILKRFGTMDWESMTMPMTMDFGDTTSGRVDANLYMQMIGSRLDICLAVNTLSYDLGNPRLVHLTTGKHILKYQEGTLDYSLLLGADCGFGLVGFTDSDWVGSVTNRKSTSGCCFSLGTAVIAWRSRK